MNQNDMTVIFVDDDTDDREIIRSILETSYPGIYIEEKTEQN